MNKTYDAILVGERCTSSSVAILLAYKGCYADMRLWEM